MRKNYLGCLVIAALVSTLQTAAWAQQKAPVTKPGLVSVAILPVEVKGLDASLGASITETVTSQLDKTGVLKVPTTKSSVDVFNQLQKRKTQLETCSTRPWCIQTVAKAFNAKVIYHVMATKAQAGVTLTMRIFDAKTGKEMRKAAEFATEDIADIQRAARWASLSVSSPVVSSLINGKGKLLVECSESGSDLTINGKSFGKKTGKGFKVSAGVFDVNVRKDGFVAYRDVVMVKPGEDQVVKAVLTPEARPAVAAAPTLSAESSKEQPRKSELPAWAVFETPKETGQAGLPATGSVKQEESHRRLAEMRGQPAFAKTPEVEKTAEEKPKEGKKFYQTWWFWTIIGVPVVGGAIALGVVLAPKNGGTTSTGSATITWK